MSKIKDLKNEFGAFKNIRNMVETYEEIAAMRMRKMKATVLQNRKFLTGVNDLYCRVSSYYRESITQKKGLRPVIGKNVSVFLSANTGLYGDVIQNVFELFSREALHSSTDVVVVGRVGKKLVEAHSPRLKFDYFDLSDSVGDRENLNKLLRHLLNYENIIIYHGFFKSVLDQEGKKTYITGDAHSLKEKKAGEEGERVWVIFEPTPEEVAVFFEEQILSVLFEHTLYESNLSKYASRMISLDRSVDFIGKKLSEIEMNINKERHLEVNKKQQNVLVSCLYGGVR